MLILAKNTVAPTIQELLVKKRERWPPTLLRLAQQKSVTALGEKVKTSTHR